MAESTNWYENEDFWQTWKPAVFSKQRITDAAAEITQILTLTGIKPPALILDLCCGVGRHSLELARRGFKVTGVDRNREYLNEAGEEAAKESLEIEFVKEDMRNFCRPKAFDMVINLFTSFGYFENQDDDRKVIDNIFRSLKLGGLVLLDMSSKEILARVFRERDWNEVEGVFWLQERQLRDDWSRIRSRWIMFKDNQRYEHTLDLRLYSASELKALLQAGGFSRIQAYGGFDGIPYDQQARRLVIVAHKE